MRQLQDICSLLRELNNYCPRDRVPGALPGSIRSHRSAAQGAVQRCTCNAFDPAGRCLNGGFGLLHVDLPLIAPGAAPVSLWPAHSALTGHSQVWSLLRCSFPEPALRNIPPNFRTGRGQRCIGSCSKRVQRLDVSKHLAKVH